VSKEQAHAAVMQRAMHTSALLGDALQHLAAASESRPPLFRGATERAGVWLGPGELPDAKPIVLRCCLPNIAALSPCASPLYYCKFQSVRNGR
jgi:hypothetical protein